MTSTLNMSGLFDLYIIRNRKTLEPYVGISQDLIARLSTHREERGADWFLESILMMGRPYHDAAHIESYIRKRVEKQGFYLSSKDLAEVDYDQEVVANIESYSDYQAKTRERFLTTYFPSHDFPIFLKTS